MVTRNKNFIVVLTLMLTIFSVIILVGDSKSKITYEGEYDLMEKDPSIMNDDDDIPKLYSLSLILNGELKK